MADGHDISEPGAAGAEPGAPADGPEPGSLEARLAEAEAKRDEYLRDLQRLAADFDNFRKRIARDQEGLVARAGERLVKELLPVLDDLERAAESVAKTAEATVAEGVRMVHRALHGALAKEGLQEVEADGLPFDPHRHEALLQQPSEADEGTVIQILQKGYRLGDRVLRPARVVVAGPPPAPAADAPADPPDAPKAG